MNAPEDAAASNAIEDTAPACRSEDCAGTLYLDDEIGARRRDLCGQSAADGAPAERDGDALLC